MGKKPLNSTSVISGELDSLTFLNYYMTIWAYGDTNMDDIDRLAIFRLHAAFCKNLADATRLLIIDALGKTERSVGDLALRLKQPQSNISKHLALMREHGLVVARREGASIYYSLSDERISEAIRLLKAIQLERIESQRALAKRGV